MVHAALEGFKFVVKGGGAEIACGWVTPERNQFTTSMTRPLSVGICHKYARYSPSALPRLENHEE